MRPNRGRKRVVPQPGGESFEIGEAGPPVRFHPLSEKATRVEPVPLDEIQIGEAGPPRKPPDPDRPLIPTAEEIARLPRLARVAFAARCARRVLPLIHRNDPLPAGEAEAVARAVEAAERGSHDPEAAEAVERVAGDSCLAGRVFVSVVAGAAQNALRTAVGQPDPLVPHPAHNAAGYAVDALTRSLTARTARLILRVRRDFDRLARLAAEQNWTDETPVPPTVFGPLWPKGLAPDWARG